MLQIGEAFLLPLMLLLKLYVCCRIYKHTVIFLISLMSALNKQAKKAPVREELSPFTNKTARIWSVYFGCCSSE